MKIEGSIVVNKPRLTVTSYFADPAFLGEYQDGFVKKEFISGQEGQDGAVSKMYYKSGKRKMELTETIVTNRLPDSFEAFYHHKHMDNTMKCRFEELGPEKTMYHYEYEYVRFSGFIPKLMAALFPGVFRKQGEKWLNQFKEFVENNG